MEKDYDNVEERIELEYDEDPDYVFNLSMIHAGQVHPVMIATKLSIAKDYVARVMAMYNKKQLDHDMLALYNPDMWIKASDNMHIFVLAEGSEYRVLRMKLDDDSYLVQQEELGQDESDVKTDNLPV